MRNKSFGCNSYVLFRLPCKHACTCVAYKRVDVKRYYSEWYSKERFVQAYLENIYPMSNLNDEIVPLLAPNIA